MKKFYLFVLAGFLVTLTTKAQVLFTNAANTYNQNFNSIGASATAVLPANWRVSKNNLTTASVGSFGSATSSTEQSAGNGMLSTSVDGIYNFGAGISSSATDRAIGGLASLTGSKSVTMFLYLKNSGIISINNFNLSYNIEKYKNGSNAAGFTVQMYYSADGSTWNSAGSNFKVSFIGGDIDNNGYVSAPQGTSTINDVMNLSLAAGNDFYLAWNYTVNSGTTTSNAQALGLDDVAITANYAVVAPVTLGSFTANVVNNEAKINWTTYNEINMDKYELEKSSDGIKFNVVKSLASYNSMPITQYFYTDQSLTSGNNFYRIKMIEKSGLASYSKIIKLFNGKQAGGVTINPTIVTNGSFNMQMNNMPKGQYQIAVFSDNGMPLLNRSINNEAGGIMSQTIALPSSIAKGMYIVRFSGRDTNINQKIVVQ